MDRVMADVLDRMVEAGLLDAAGVERARSMRAEGRPLDEALRKVSDADEESLIAFLAEEFDLPVADLEAREPDKVLLARFPARILLEHRLLPIEERDGVVVAATSRLFDDGGLDELRVACGADVRIALVPSVELDRHMKQWLGIGADTLQSLASAEDSEARIEVLDEGPSDDGDLEDAAEDASIIKFVNQVLAEAIGLRATDVHFEPFEEQLRVRYRVDGVLVEANIPASVSRFRAAIVSRLKILSHLDIAEKRLPQDGRIKLKIAGREIDVRVSVIPMLHGEAVVLRILDRGAALLGIEHLGMAEHDAGLFGKTLGLPHGIVLVTGPTGSGKTTTLYAGLSRINEIERKIVTIEDPVEYQLHGVNQIQVSEKTGLSFARGLRAILRHDPDVVLVGEIRDRETAAIAVQASLTGHLVFSTLHTNDAPGALTRLIDMGIEPYLVASSLELVIAQRLVRLICEGCREAVAIRDAGVLREEFGSDLPDELYHGRGCRACRQTGYRGRRGIFEMMPVSDRVRGMVLEHASSRQIRAVAVEEGMSSLRTDGWRLVRDGKTTLEEVLRVTKDERASNGGGVVAVLEGRDGEAPAGKGVVKGPGVVRRPA